MEHSKEKTVQPTKNEKGDLSNCHFPSKVFAWPRNVKRFWNENHLATPMPGSFSYSYPTEIALGMNPWIHHTSLEWRCIWTHYTLAEKLQYPQVVKLVSTHSKSIWNHHLVKQLEEGFWHLCHFGLSAHLPAAQGALLVAQTRAILRPKNYLPTSKKGVSFEFMEFALGKLTKHLLKYRASRKFNKKWCDGWNVCFVVSMYRGVVKNPMKLSHVGWGYCSLPKSYLQFMFQHLALWEFVYDLLEQAKRRYRIRRYGLLKANRYL